MAAWLIISLIFLGLFVLLAIGVPVAFAFLAVNMVAAFCLWGGFDGLDQLTMSIYGSVINFSLLPVPLFILMGELMFRSGIGAKIIETLDKWIGRVPGRLSILAVLAGVFSSTLSGSSMASAAMLGSVLVPEMQKRGYHGRMTLGPILGSGGLAIMIPPSALGVILASLARFPVGDFLIAIILPGLIMAVFYSLYIIIQACLHPDQAPQYSLEPQPLAIKLLVTIRYLLPSGLVVFMVIGLIFLGVATPTEAAAMGALSCFVLAIVYSRGNWKAIYDAISGAVKASVMILMILTASVSFSQILAYTGATAALVEWAAGLSLAPIYLIIMMQLVLLMLGMFLDAMPIMLLTIPIFVPILESLGVNLLWFGVIMLLNMEMAMTSPPFGLTLFVMKAVAPPETTMGDIYRAALPFLACDLAVMVMIMVFPGLVLMLPAMM